MKTVLKLKPIQKEPAPLSEIPPLGKNRSHLKLVWENSSVSGCPHREKSEAKLQLVSGQTLFGYVLQNPVNFIDPIGLAPNPYSSFTNRLGLGIAAPLLNHGLEQGGINVDPSARIFGGVSSLGAAGIVALNSSGIVVPLLLSGAGGWEIGSGLYRLNPDFFINNIGEPIFNFIHECR